jgi:hypothetical protein
MPKSKTHYKRKMKQREKHQKQEKWVKKKVAEFNALPEEAKLGMLSKWGYGKKGEPDAVIFDEIEPQEGEEDAG